MPFPTLGDDDDDDDFIILRSRNHSAPMLALQVGAHQTWGHYMDLMGGRGGAAHPTCNVGSLGQSSPPQQMIFSESGVRPDDAGILGRLRQEKAQVQGSAAE